jgi:hypothetical protein
MIKTTPKNLLKVIVAITITTLLYIFVYWPISPLGSQLHNLELAEKQAKIFRERFKDDTRFQKVKFGGYTGCGGCFAVTGEVQSEDDICFLTNIVESISCPIEIYYVLSASNGFVVFQWMDRHDRAPLWSR